jgi:signal recognition particle receptor subunit beta
MVFFNYSTMQMAAKVVYYGPGLCGKTTNLHYIYGHTTNDSRGEMVSLETETDRTLFFDLLPLDVGSIAGFNTRIQLYTVPGQVFYNTTRKLVLKGVDGVVFVVDSQRAMLQTNLDSFRNLEENLAEMGLSVDTLPLVLQYNKRDLADICSVEELNQALNRQGWPWFETSAVSGQGVFETLKGISKHTLLALKKRLGRSGADAPARLSAPGMPRPGALLGTAGAAAAQAPAGPPLPATSMAPPPPAAGPSPAPSAPAYAYQSAPPSPAPAASGAQPATATPAAPLPQVAAAAQTQPPSPAALAAKSGSAAPPTQPTPAGVTPQPPAPAGAAVRPPAPGGPPASGTRSAKISTGQRRSVDVLSELEKLRREAMQPPSSATGTHQTSQPPSAASLLAAGAAPARGRASASGASSNGRAELSRNIEMTLKRSEFVRARRILLSFQVEDDQHRVVDAVRDLQVEIKDIADLEKLLLRFNIALHAKE